MKKYIGVVIIVLVILVVLFSHEIFYIVSETEQVVVTRLGKPVGDPIVNAGLYLKMPFVDKTRYFDKRILRWDGDPNEIPTKDKRYIFVDTTARWRINDALLFFKTVFNEMGAASRLDDIIDSATRRAIRNYKLIESVRNTNRLLEIPQVSDSGQPLLDKEASEEIKLGRNKLTELIIKDAKKTVAQYGIELIDVRIKSIKYNESVLQKVYERMIAERKRAAEKYRSEGQGEKAEIEGKTTKELQTIESEAYRKVQEIRGKADADALKIYAEAYGKDPEFYGLLKTLETYETTLDDKTVLMIGTDWEYFKYLQGTSQE